MLFLKFSLIFASSLAANTNAFTLSVQRVGRLSKSAFEDHSSQLGVTIVSEHSSRTSSRLFYRAHEERDDDDILSQLRTRAAPTFQKSDIQKSMEKRRRGINGLFVVSLITNQIVILILAVGLTALYVFFSGNEQFYTEGILNWNGATEANNLLGLDLSVTPVRFIQGLLGSIPTIALSHQIERSDDRKYSQTNFSTIFMVMTLFGRRSSNSKVKGKRIKIDNLDQITNTLGKSDWLGCHSSVLQWYFEVTDSHCIFSRRWINSSRSFIFNRML